MKLFFTLLLTLICCICSYGQMVTLGTEFFISLEALGQPGFSMLSK